MFVIVNNILRESDKIVLNMAPIVTINSAYSAMHLLPILMNMKYQGHIFRMPSWIDPNKFPPRDPIDDRTLILGRHSRDMETKFGKENKSLIDLAVPYEFHILDVKGFIQA